MVFKEILHNYKIGKDLGLSQKEINNTLLFRDRYPLVIALMLLIVLMVFATIFWNVALILYAQSIEPVYPRGTLYSSINIKDFKIKK
jgi:hypothetical protein